MDATPTEAIKFRIKKLLNLAADASNENEAAQAGAMAQKLLRQHNLELADVEALDPSMREAVDRFEWTALVYPNNKVLGWREDLFNTIAITSWAKAYVDAKGGEYYYDAIGRMRRKRTRLAWIVGRKTDVEVAEYLFVYLTREIERLAELHTRAFGKQVRRGAQTKYRQAFLKGAAHMIIDRLRHEWDKSKKHEEGVHALVLVRDAEVNNWLDKYVGKLSTKKSYRVSADATGWHHGQAAAREIDLNRGIEGAGQKRIEG